MKRTTRFLQELQRSAFEVFDHSPTGDNYTPAASVRIFIKWIFDLFKNAVAVAAFKAFARSNHSHFLAVAGSILEFMIGIYVFTYSEEAVNYCSKRIGKLSGLTLITILLTVFGSLFISGVNVLTLKFVDLVSTFQTK